jgi:hypothetical protein
MEIAPRRPAGDQCEAKGRHQHPALSIQLGDHQADRVRVQSADLLDGR